MSSESRTGLLRFIPFVKRENNFQKQLSNSDKIRERRVSRERTRNLEVRRELEVPKNLITENGTAELSVTTLQNGDWWVTKVIPKEDLASAAAGKELGVVVFQADSKDKALTIEQAFMDDSLEEAHYTDVDDELVQKNRERFSKRIYTVKPLSFR